MEGNIASARMRIKEGLKLYKEIYGNLKDAQTNAGELKSKFSFVKAAQVYIKLADYEGEIGENSGYYYSEEYQQACEACIRLTETALRDVGTDAVEKLRCDITQLSQYKNTYKRVVDVLKRKGFASLAIQIQDRLVQIEKDLVTTQKYTISAARLSWNAFFSICAMCLAGFPKRRWMIPTDGDGNQAKLLPRVGEPV